MKIYYEYPEEARRALAILRALPESEHKLGAMRYLGDDCRCVVGVLVPETCNLPPSKQGSHIGDLNLFNSEIQAAIARTGFSKAFLAHIQAVNDASDHLTPRERYKIIVSQLEVMTGDPNLGKDLT